MRITTHSPLMVSLYSTPHSVSASSPIPLAARVRYKCRYAYFSDFLTDFFSKAAATRLPSFLAGRFRSYVLAFPSGERFGKPKMSSGLDETPGKSLIPDVGIEKKLGVLSFSILYTRYRD